MIFVSIQWNIISQVSKLYHGAALQTFQHLKHQDYACLGPYIKNWMAGAASWHPSIIAHRLRASHHAYFWLVIWLDALKDIEKHLRNHRTPEFILTHVNQNLDRSYKPYGEIKHKSHFADNMTCYTDYQPRAVQEVSLKDRVIHGLGENGDEHYIYFILFKAYIHDFNVCRVLINGQRYCDDHVIEGWHHLIYEELVDKNLVLRSKKNQYLDFKYLLYCSETAGPLSLAIRTSRPGPVFICQTPGIWGALPNGFVKLWESNSELYVTTNVANYTDFHFDKTKATLYSFFYERDLDLCMQVL